MPNLRKSTLKIVAVVCSDLHFSGSPPIARSAEPDWYEAMRRQWSQLRQVAGLYKVPVIVAGDIFDHWKSSPQVISFAIEMFSGLRVFAVPGQHDLPNHSYGDIKRSAYWTLVEAGAVNNVEPGCRYDVNGMMLFGFPWGTDIVPQVPREDGRVDYLLNVAVIHKYVWTGEYKYQGAPSEDEVTGLKRALNGYDVAIIGDNHKGFMSNVGGCRVMNCGGFIPRKSDERDMKPWFGVLDSRGDIEPVFLDLSGDKWLDEEALLRKVDETLDLRDLVNGLESLGVDALDFADVLIRYLDQHKVSSTIRRLVTSSLDKGKKSA